MVVTIAKLSFSISPWEPKVPPPKATPPRNKALIRPYSGKPTVNSPLIRPYLLEGVVLGGGGTLDSQLFMGLINQPTGFF